MVYGTSQDRFAGTHLLSLQLLLNLGLLLLSLMLLQLLQMILLTIMHSSDSHGGHILSQIKCIHQ